MVNEVYSLRIVSWAKKSLGPWDLKIGLMWLCWTSPGFIFIARVVSWEFSLAMKCLALFQFGIKVIFRRSCSWLHLHYLSQSRTLMEELASEESVKRWRMIVWPFITKGGTYIHDCTLDADAESQLVCVAYDLTKPTLLLNIIATYRSAHILILGRSSGVYAKLGNSPVSCGSWQLNFHDVNIMRHEWDTIIGSASYQLANCMSMLSHYLIQLLHSSRSFLSYVYIIIQIDCVDSVWCCVKL